MGTAAFVSLCSLFALLGGAEFSESLKNVSIEVPVAVRVGQSVALECRYDLEGESLYMLKWYKGRSEFYRFVPKELPNTRVFPVPTVDVDVHLSGANRVVLRNVRQDLAGKYRCEVSADAPSFHTQVVASTMHVVHAADGVPNLILEKKRYSIGDTLRANCTSPPSTPAANITWYINDKQVNASFHNRHQWTANGNEAHKMRSKSARLYATSAGLQRVVDGFEFRQLRIACVADLFQTFLTRAEIVLHQRNPKLELGSIVYTMSDSTYTSTSTSYGPPSTRLLVRFERCPTIATLVATLSVLSYVTTSLTIALPS